MRVAFIGKDHEFSNAPLDAVASAHEVVALIEAPARGSKAERPRFGLRAAVPSWAHGRRGAREGWRRRSAQMNAVHFALTRDSLGELAPLLRQLRVEVVCVASLPLLLPPELLAVPPFGFVNLHPSLLPRYHGPFPWFWQYHDFQTQLGASVHALDAGQDTGDLYVQEPVEIALGQDILESISIVSAVGARLMLETVTALEGGITRRTPQPTHAFPKARVVRRDERFIDWEEWSLDRVWHFLRGTYPWVDSVDLPAGHWRYGSVERSTTSEEPGAVVRDSEGWYVSHPDGKIRLLPATV